MKPTALLLALALVTAEHALACEDEPQPDFVSAPMLAEQELEGVER